MEINFTLNHKVYQLDVDASKRLIDIVRELGYTSVKEGCGEGECGACSLFFNNKLVNSCLLLAGQIDGATLMTLEGLLKETETIRQNFASKGAIQCGFCTSGFELRALDYIQNGGIQDEKLLKEALDGNICRCTGYQKITDAILESMR